MGTHSATDSCTRQQLILASHSDKLQPMVANSKEDFSKRLNQACDEARPPIISGRGRREELRRRLEHQQGLKLSGESVRKWLSAESIPSMDNVRFLAALLGVNTDWLLTGRLPARPGSSDQPRNEAAQDSASYSFISDPTTREVVEIMTQLDEPERNQILGLAKGLLLQKTHQVEPFNQATGT